MDVKARQSLAAFAVGSKERLQLLDQIGLDAEVAEIGIAALRRRLHGFFHAATIVAMKGVALDEGRFHVLAAENLIERLADGGGACA